MTALQPRRHPGNRPSPVKAAVFAVTPAAGGAITRRTLIAAVKIALPDTPRSTIAAAIQGMATDRVLERVGRGRYRRPPGFRCVNCGTLEDVALRSYDLDLPTIALCGWCSLLIVTDREMFDALRGRRTR